MKRIALFVAFLCLSVSLPSCAWWGSDTSTAIRRSTIDCTVEAVKANAAHLLPVVMAIVTGHAPNWREQLATFGKEFGRDALACSLQMAAIELQNRVAMGGPSDKANENQSALVKTRTYVSEQRWTYVAPE